jgi:ribonuclease HI
VKRVSLITDGSCLGNPGPGGWAAILRFGEKKKEFFGYDPHTTNNRMELMAPIQGLLAIKEPCEVEITTDSEYVRQGATLSLPRWRAGHWWRGKYPLRNADLWIELDELVSIHQVHWLWTKGHADHEDNNRCDWLAQNGARTQSCSCPMEDATAPSATNWAGAMFRRDRRPVSLTISAAKKKKKSLRSGDQPRLTCAPSAFTAAPMMAIRSSTGVISKTLPCSGLIFTIS